jgi:hypothetical protein
MLIKLLLELQSKRFKLYRGTILISWVGSWLPDHNGIIAYQKSQFRKILEGLGIEKLVGIFYCNVECLPFGIFCGHLGDFLLFFVCCKKIWQPWIPERASSPASLMPFYEGLGETNQRRKFVLGPGLPDGVCICIPKIPIWYFFLWYVLAR